MNNSQESKKAEPIKANGGHVSQVPQSGEFSHLFPPQGRRVSLGPAPRRSSLDHLNDALFARRPSLLGESDILARRSSLDSTTAAYDAALMDITRRRLSMAGGMTDPLSVDPLAGIGGLNYGLGGVASMNPLSLGKTSLAASLPTQDSFQLNLRQKQLQEKQRELELRQAELEIQRRQIMSAMDDRQLSVLPPTDQMRRNSLTNLGTQSLLMGLPNPGLTANDKQWHICKLCNSKAFASRDELMAHESVCLLSGQARRSSLDLLGRRSSLDLLGRRSSLDMLGTLAGTNPGLALSRIAGNHSINGQAPNMNPSLQMTKKKKKAPAKHVESPHLSNGPYTNMKEPMTLALELDKQWLTPLHCFLRRHCVEVFTATEEDISTPSKGKRKTIGLGQVGIRCPHCHRDPTVAIERGSVYYPTSLHAIYNATMNLLQRHLHSCRAVPLEVMKEYETLKGDDARSGTSKRYWIASAVSIGLVDTPHSGIRYSGVSVPIEKLGGTGPNDINFSNTAKSDGEVASNEASASADDATEGNADDTGGQTGKIPIIVCEEDEPYGTAFSYLLMQQMRPCVFAEADRLGKRKNLPPGFPGLACIHCYGGYGSGRFFPSSIKTLSDTSKTLNVLHNHMTRCRKCPIEIRKKLIGLRESHDQERASMKFGSQKAFFARIWDRLHENDPSLMSSRKRKYYPPLERAPGPTGTQVRPQVGAIGLTGTQVRPQVGAIGLTGTQVRPQGGAIGLTGTQVRPQVSAVGEIQHNLLTGTQLRPQVSAVGLTGTQVKPQVSAVGEIQHNLLNAINMQYGGAMGRNKHPRILPP